MVTADATASTIIGARDSGIHEFLRKPFTSADLLMRILAAALDQFDSDPMQAVRSIREQASTLKSLAMKASDSRLAVAVGALEVTLASGPPCKATLAAPIGSLLAMAPPALKKAG